MLLGTRWAVGAAAPASLPPVVLAAVRGVEEELRAGGIDTRGWGWTLTYLERQPIVDLDDGTRIRYLLEQDHALITNADLDDAADDDERSEKDGRSDEGERSDEDERSDGDR